MANRELTGSVLKDRYRLTRVLGAGGMGQVYEGLDETLECKVAIKVLLSKLADEQKFRGRFMREAKAASKVRHPNVVKITDFGEHSDGSVFFVMEFLEGLDLQQLLRKEKTLPWARARHILLQIVSAIGATHDRGIVHRDIKPANFFLVDARGLQDFVKLLDFGIAKLVTEPTETDQGLALSLTGTGEVFGTAKYMAPEVAYGETKDPRIDVYAVGIVAYEMLVGRVPFEGASVFEILKKHVDEPPRPPREIDPTIPLEVEAMVLRALAKKPHERFGSMDELEAAISAIAENAGAVTTTVTMPRGKPVRSTTPLPAVASTEPKPEPHDDDAPVKRSEVSTEPAPAAEKAGADAEAEETTNVAVSPQTAGPRTPGVPSVGVPVAVAGAPSSSLPDGGSRHSTSGAIEVGVSAPEVGGSTAVVSVAAVSPGSAGVGEPNVVPEVAAPSVVMGRSVSYPGAVPAAVPVGPSAEMDGVDSTSPAVIHGGVGSSTGSMRSGGAGGQTGREQLGGSRPGAGRVGLGGILAGVAAVALVIGLATGGTLWVLDREEQEATGPEVDGGVETPGESEAVARDGAGPVAVEGVAPSAASSGGAGDSSGGPGAADDALSEPVGSETSAPDAEVVIDEGTTGEAAVDEPPLVEEPKAAPPPSKPDKPSKAECEKVRSDTNAAKSSFQWKTVLKLTKSRDCWSGSAKLQRKRLRVAAFAETGDYRRCVREGGSSSDKEISARVGWCKRKLG